MMPSPDTIARRSVRLMAFLALAWLGACSPSPDTLIVLMPNLDGSVGRVDVGNAAGTQTLSGIRQATGANTIGAMPVAPFEVSSRDVQEIFADALGVQPPTPDIFLLYFETGGAGLTPSSSALLPKIAFAVKGRAVPDVSVVGHTDRVGRNDVNVPLSLERATGVRDALVAVGVDAALIEVSSHGEDNPLVPTQDEIAEPRNRRVEVTIR